MCTKVNMNTNRVASKANTAENNRARNILRRQADELRLQIDAVRRELDDPPTSPAELHRGNDMRAHG